jgi:amino acid adenylation domain-containing protein
MPDKRALVEAALRRKLDKLERPVTAPGQDWILFLDRLQPSAALYNIAAAIELRGELQGEALQGALSTIVQRHESLRAVFQLEAGGAFGVSVRPPEPVELPVTDLRWYPAAQRVGRAEQIARQEAGHRFDVARDLLFRFHVIRLDDACHWLVVVVHHAIFDLVSMGVLLRELGELYTARVTGRAPALPELTYTFREFARQQRKLQEGGDDESAQYWRSVLAGSLPVLQLPTDRIPAHRSFHGATYFRSLPADLIDGLTAVARREGASLFMALLAAYNVLLHRYTGQEDIVVGTPVGNRTRVEMEPLIGMFINTVAIRTQVADLPTFRTLLGQVRERALGAFAHAELPFPQVVKSLERERPEGRSPVFQTMFMLNNAPLDIQLHGLQARLIDGLETTAKFDLSLTVSQLDRAWSAGFTYDTDVFDEVTVSRMADHYLQLLTAIVANPDHPVEHLPMLTAADRDQLLHHWNATEHPVPADRLIHQIVADRAWQHPDAVAVVQEHEQLTYAELDARAGRVAAALAAQGVGPGSMVGVCLERSIGMVVGLLGVLKAGAAYVAMDPAHPTDRLLRMLRDTEAAALVTAGPLQARFGECGVPVLCLDGDLPPATGAQPAIPHAAMWNQTAYVIFTSGSTGVPKGIMVTHRNLLNAVTWFMHAYELREGDRTSQFIGPGFDPTVFEIWGTLAAGATLHIVLESTKYDPAQFRDWLVANRIHVSVLTTQVVEALVALPWPADTTLRAVLAGGDKLTRFPPPSLPFEVVNNYGPTETTVVSIAAAVPKLENPSGLPSIGRPIFNTQVYLLDRHMQLVPVGVPGEIYIGGEGVAKGYVGRPDLTRERFVENPFVPGARIYRTGDVARYRPDGSLEYIGRNDAQVKIRGLRIELGEIEAVLQQHPAVQQCLVLVREDEPGDKQLVAYLVLGQSGEAVVEGIRQHLRQVLPTYMVPAAFVPMPAFPLTPNSKIDLQALPRPVRSGTATRGATPPAGGTERKVAEVWREVLGAERIGSKDNFFDLGGHSLRLVQVQNLLRQKLNVEVPLLELFQFPTVSSLAKRIDQLSNAAPEFDSGTDEGRPGTAAAPDRNQPIAIVGLAGRFPEANDLAQFWANLQAGRESISRFSRQELEQEGIEAAMLHHPSYVPAKGTLEGYDLFDAGFFGYSPREAETLDPQQRLFLECCWEALEQAGYVSEASPERVGVFAGATMSTYLLNNLLGNSEHIRKAGFYQTIMGNDNGFLATRTAYKLNLNGPAVTVQTACSTSLVAVHMACQSLLSGECDMALAGGASVSSPMKEGYIYHEGEIMSPEGRCRAFDAEAKGTVNGSGLGVVALKRLQDALADGDTIHAVIRGSAVNNDGAGKVGFTAPAIDGQVAVVQAALDAAGVNPNTVTYVEAHGTGTVLGDPIEVAALTRAYRGRGVTRNQYCALGSVKPNIGHLDAAAGVAGLLKTVLALKARQLPPSLHFETPNPKIDFANSPFYVNAELAPWESDGVRRAGVSSFGVGGTNVHVILEEAPAVAPPLAAEGCQVLPVSARSPQALESSLGALARHLEQNPDLPLADVAYTLQVGRAEFAHRSVLVGRSTAEVLATLKTRAATRFASGEAGTGREVVFLFPGQGAQYVNMGRDLYDSYPVFRHHVDACAGVLKEWLGLDLREVTYPAPERVAEAAEQLNETALTQPALFAIEYALARLWMSWGWQPQAMIGHSLGEYVAACLAGVFSLEEALCLVAVRGRLMQRLEPGAMLAVALSEQELQPLLPPDVAIAACNGPQATVVSGREAEVERLRVELERRGVQVRRLHTSHAFHSSMMDPILAEFEQEVRRVKLAPPGRPYVSNLTGTWITAAEATDPAYWVKHLRHTVRFAEGLSVLAEDRQRVFLEVGPGRTLCTFAVRNHSELDVLASIRHVQDPGDDVAHLLLTLGRLWVAGVDLPWSRTIASQPGRRVPLPTYPFERKQYWVEMPHKVGADLAGGTSRSQEVGQPAPMPDRGAPLEEPAEGLERAVAEVWQEVLGIDAISRQEGVFDLGADSLMAARAAGRLREIFPIAIPVSLLFEAPTVSDLAQRIEALLIEKLDSLSDEEVTIQGR